MTYTTAQLIDFLDQELQANWRGERVLLSPQQRINNPAIAMALDPGKLSKVFAYREYRSQIHQYQRDNNVSGIVWRACRFQGQECRYPELHRHLIAINGDKEILKGAKATTIAFWTEQAAATGIYWLVGDAPILIPYPDLQKRFEEAEWAILDAAQTGLYLGLCWGNPEEAHCDWARPGSGCDRIIAAIDCPHSIKI